MADNLANKKEYSVEMISTISTATRTNSWS